jgi:hypothetical protein
MIPFGCRAKHAFSVTFDVEVYADQHAEMLLDLTAAPDGPGSLEEMETEHAQALEDAAEFEAFNRWADETVQTLPEWPAQVWA